MQRFLISAIVLVSLAVTGCQTVPTSPAPWRWKPCSARPFDAGFCEQPSNFYLFGWLIGAQ
jgi:hypothetical protein